MSMLDRLWGIVLKLTDPRPALTYQRCLLEHHAVGGCDWCQRVCPHEAIDLESGKVELDEVRCTGCGLCTAVCPGVALEFPLGPIQKILFEGQGSLRCSQAGGSGQEVQCLGRLTPGVLAEAALRVGGVLTLAHGDCESCKIGGPEVPQRVMEVLTEARRYAPNARLELLGGGLPDRGVSRRELFGALFERGRRTAAVVLPEPPGDWVEENTARPAELRLRAMAARKAEEGLSWPAIQVEEGCTLCPVCTNVCPTQAVVREHDGDKYVLRFDPLACTGCEACVKSCPPQVMGMKTLPDSESLGLPVELFRGEPPWEDW